MIIKHINPITMDAFERKLLCVLLSTNRLTLCWAGRVGYDVVIPSEDTTTLVHYTLILSHDLLLKELSEDNEILRYVAINPSPVADGTYGEILSVEKTIALSVRQQSLVSCPQYADARVIKRQTIAPGKATYQMVHHEYRCCELVSH